MPKGKGGYETVFLPFADFKPYDTEGKAIVVDPPTLQLEGVRWLNFMVRTYYGEKEQAGPFWLGVKKVRVVDVKGKAKCLVKY